MFKRACSEERNQHISNFSTRDWVHYSASAPILLQDVEPFPGRGEYTEKPRGIYCAPGDKWIERCDEMGMFPHSYKFRCEVRWSKGLRILLVPVKLKLLSVVRMAKECDGCYISSSAILEAQKCLGPYGWMAGMDVETLVIWNASKLKITYTPWSIDFLEETLELEDLAIFDVPVLRIIDNYMKT
jgi:hypothetical protein